MFLLTEFEHMEIHAKTLFTHDPDGRITHLNEPPYNIAPRFFLGRTKCGNVVRYLNTLNEHVKKTLDRLIRNNSHIHLEEIFRLLSEDGPINSVGIEPVYVFPDVRNRPTRAIRITDSNKSFLKPHFPYTFEELDVRNPCFAMLENDMAVAVCSSARQTSMAAEASLYTLEDFRGRAYGTDVCNAWAAEVQSQGRIAFYSAAWDNFSSQAVARKLLLIQYGVDIHIC